MNTSLPVWPAPADLIVTLTPTVIPKRTGGPLFDVTIRDDVGDINLTPADALRLAACLVEAAQWTASTATHPTPRDPPGGDPPDRTAGRRKA